MASSLRTITLLGGLVTAASYGPARGADHRSAVVNIIPHVYGALELRLMAESRRKMEATYPKGSVVYYYDNYEIDDGNDSLTVMADTTFLRNRSGSLSVIDEPSGRIYRVFSPRATVQLLHDSGEMIVRPGETPNAILRNLLVIGGARFGKTLTTRAP